MARIHELLRQLRLTNAALADDIEREVDVLGARRAFGLNFERHTPEAVELPGRPVRAGDKVHVLPPRGETPKAINGKLWRVVAIEGSGADRVATLESHPASDAVNTTKSIVEDLVVVAEFRDPIYPGLVSTGKVERGGDRPFHTVISGENFHALQVLLFTHRGKVDAIYVDPPYNTGAKDWKYNNDYVEGDDLYRHSKWLAFMERRLMLAKDLMNHDGSVLIITIDEKEYLRLGMLLEQVFPEGRIQMVSSSISPSGMARGLEFRRSDEYLFFVALGDAAPTPLPLGEAWLGGRSTSTGALRWNGLMRSGTEARRQDRPGMFYPVFVSTTTHRILAVGAPLPPGGDRSSISIPENCVAIWPVRTDGTEGRWQISAESAAALIPKGYIRAGRFNGERTAIAYLKSGEQAKVEQGVFGPARIGDGGFIEVAGRSVANVSLPTTQWSLLSHSAAEFGSTMLRSFVPGRRFPFPKSLYAVEDALRFFVKERPDATIVDFFAGSGTTAHAVARLNRQDGGHRISISVTNNEISPDEESILRSRGIRPGDPDWEARGICDYITKPRIAAAFTGSTPDGAPIKGDYKFTDEFPMAEGFDENVEFLTLTYEASLRIRANRDFGKVAGLLWLKAGSRGRRIESLPDGWDVTESYGVLGDLDRTEVFLQAIESASSVTVAFIVTDDDGLFEGVVAALPERVEPVRLYDSYLRNFEIDAMRSVR